MTEPRTVKNMYKYVAERMKERLSNMSVVLLNSLNQAEELKSLVEETSQEIQKLVAGLEEDFKIIRKLEKKVEEHKQ